MKRLIQRTRILAFMALCIPMLAVAAPTPPEELAENTVQTLLDAMEGRRDTLRQNPQELYALVNQELVPLVDMDYMSQLVLGRYWRTATPEQRARFQQAFKSMLVRTYGNALLGFDEERIEYLPVRAEDGADDITFRALVTTDSGDQVPVSLDMHLVDGQWKVYDGSVGNLSFVSNYRSQFNAQIRNGGLESLLTRMEERYGTGNG